MNKRLKQPYNPIEEEKTITELWQKEEIGNPDANIRSGFTKKDAPVFSIVLPPPNVTGVLHMGHAAMLAIEDIMVRYHRMKGFRTLWLPGTDHAAIATQSKVEKLLSKEGVRKHDLGREKFLEKVRAFAQESHDSIVRQIQALGSSVDWSREAYTLDAAREHAVFTAFERMYKDGLIYRKERVVNWDPKGQTVISDDEIIYQERKAMLYTFRYGKDFPIPISTTRPETKVGDTAVAVHPSDERYQQLIGKEFDLVFCHVPIHVKVIADESVDPAFGTGALGVTPAHSGVDWLLAEKHGLPLVQVIDERGKMSVAHEDLKGKKTTEAREVILSWLRSEGLLEKEEEINQNISTAERTGAIIEPLPKLQWFIDVNKEFVLEESHLPGIQAGQTTTLKTLLRHVVEQKLIAILPDRFEKIYFHWIDGLRDWCISRQIWFGHRIPVWYHEEKCIPRPGHETDMDHCEPLIVSEQKPKCAHCDAEYVQDPDTLDTWFSSGLWTFSTLGWPEKTDDFRTYHPTSVIETGYDILFFWIARMILMSTYLLGDLPFRSVYLHGLVRDGKGQKMSKSLGNIIDPLEMAQKYGADATRISLIIGAAPGNDIKLSEDKIRGYKHFANKLWNIGRFVVERTAHTVIAPETPLLPQDEHYVSEWKTLRTEITDDIEHFRYYLAGEKLYHYLWHTFADVIIEETKIRLQNGSAEEQASAARTLRSILIEALHVLHPFMPFVTESLWQILPSEWKQNRGTMLALSPWPEN